MIFKRGQKLSIKSKNRFSKEKRILNLHKQLDNYRIFSILLDELIIVVNKSYLNATVFGYNCNSIDSKDKLLLRAREDDLHAKRYKLKKELWDLIEYLPAVLEISYNLDKSYYTLSGNLNMGFLLDFGVYNYRDEYKLESLARLKGDFGFHSKVMAARVKAEIVNLEKELDSLVK